MSEKLYKKLLVVFFVFIFSCVSAVSVKRPDQKPYKPAPYQSVMQVVDLNTKILGSGFAVTKDYLITAGHVCSAILEANKELGLKPSIIIQFFDSRGEFYAHQNVKIHTYDTKRDLCLMEVVDHGLPFVIFGSEKLKQGDDVYSIGGPGGFFPTKVRGYVTSPDSGDIGEGSILNNKIVTSVPVHYGSSGAPLFNAKDEVVGVVVIMYAKFSVLSFSVTLNELQKFIAENT